MKRCFAVLVAMGLCLFVFASVALAENAEWKDSSFNFKAVEKIYVEPEVVYGEDTTISDIDEMKIREAIENNKVQTKKFRFVHDKTIADAVVQINISQWGSHRYWHEPETYTEYETITHTDKNGKTSTTTIPVTKTRDGYYVYTEYFSVKYTMTDMNGNVIYERVDSREDQKNAFSMFGRATKDFYKAISKLK